MRLTDVAAGGGASFAPARQEAPPVQHSAAHEPCVPSAAGLAAAVLSGFVGDFYRATEEGTNILADLEFALPQIVVVGQESSGKSSVLEALAMLPLFPRDSVMCTKLPILLKLRHGNVDVEGDPDLMPHCGKPQAKQQIKMKLTYSDGRKPVESDRNFTPDEAAQLMRKWMEEIVAQEGEEGVVDHVLEIEVQSPHVPNLNVVDLPGIVAGRRVGEPVDMMQRTRAVVEKYLKMPNTLVLAVVPAFERVRNSQAFQLVQQYNLMDSTIGVLTMMDRAVDATNPDAPLSEVMSRLEGTSQDVVDLKHGYVAVKNRDTRLAPALSLDEAKAEENAWLEEKMPGYIDRGLASSSVLAKKLEEILADHARATWVPQALAKIETQRRNCYNTLASLGPSAEDIVSDFVGVSPTTARKRMLQLITPILPGLLERVDEDILQLAAIIHEDCLQSREEHELILAPFHAKKPFSARTHSGSLVAASILMLDSHGTYITDHLVQILKNVVLHIVHLVQKTIGLEQKGGKLQRLDRFANLHYFFAGVLWERLNELLINDEDLLEHLEKSFLEFDPENASLLQLPTQVKKMPTKAADELKTLANALELYLDSKGFHSTSLDEIYVPSVPPANISLDREMCRLIVSAQVPTNKPRSSGFGDANQTRGGFNFGSHFTAEGFNFPAATQPLTEEYQEIGEFEARVFFAVTSHVVAPLLQSICDVSDLARKMQEYVSCHPKVQANKVDIFYDSTADTRKVTTNLVKRLDKMAARLNSPSFH
ncbi:hypothetical protein PRIC2_009421 [Phytophthora ramorum]